MKIATTIALISFLPLISVADNFCQLPVNSTIEFKADLHVPANSTILELAGNQQDPYCDLRYEKSENARVLRAGQKRTATSITRPQDANYCRVNISSQNASLTLTCDNVSIEQINQNYGHIFTITPAAAQDFP